MYAMDTKSITDVEIKKSGWLKIKNVIISGNRFLPKGYATFRLYI